MHQFAPAAVAHLVHVSIIPFFDPGQIATDAIRQLLLNIAKGAATMMGTALEKLAFTTGDLTLDQGVGGWNQPLPPLTHNQVVEGTTALVRHISEACLTIVLLYAFLRSMWEHSFRAHYSLKALLSRLLTGVVLSEFSSFFCQEAIDLNNALGRTILYSGMPFSPDKLPWEAFAARMITDIADPFTLLVMLIILVALGILIISYMIRFIVLCVLVVFAPAAALLGILPDTRHFAEMWSRLFVTTLFTQPIQLLILKMGIALNFIGPSRDLSAIYSLAVIYIALKVPSAMGASGHMANQTIRLVKHVETVARRSVSHATRPTHARAA